MRVLFIANPGVGHVYPMVPLAWALRASGDEVLMSTGGDGLAVADAGLPVIDLLAGLDRRAMLARLRAEQPEAVAQRLHARIEDLRQEAPRFARMSMRMAEAALPLAEGWRPDLIVQSQYQGAGYLLAAKLHIPLITHGIGFAPTSELAQLLRQHMQEAFDRHAVTGLPSEHIQLHVAPPSMLETHPEGWWMRYIPYNGGSVLAAPPSAPAALPRVAVTLGTVAPQTTGLDPLRRIVALAQEVEAEFVLALGSDDAEGLGPLPANVSARGWVPLQQLLPSCAAIIHHGGGGTALTAIACGTPQLVLPSGADRFINASAVERSGAGLVASPQDLTPALIERLLTDENLKRAAEEAREEAEAMPSPARTAHRLRGFATAGG